MWSYLLSLMKGKGPQTRVFSPGDKGELRRDSSALLEQGMYVIEAVGLEWQSHQRVLFECIKSTAPMGFFLVMPWHPNVRKIQTALLALFSNSKTDGHNVFGYFDLTFENVEALFSLRQQTGGWGGGEWYIGGCLEEFQMPKLNIKSSEDVVEVFFREAKNIGCFLYLEENRQSMLLVRPFERLEQSIQAIVT